MSKSTRVDGDETATNVLREGQPWKVALPGGMKLSMVWIRPGEFMMGSPEERKKGGLFGLGGKMVQQAEEGRYKNEGPQTRVRLTKGFWLGSTQVTQGQWKGLMRTNPSCFIESGPNAPVDCVSWDDAMEFCSKLTERERREGRLPNGYEYTLPTEAQWEYAARAGTISRWWFGNDESDLSRYDWYVANSNDETQEVGQKAANPWGLYDVHGNVAEWTRSWYATYPGGTQVDYNGPNTGECRVLRGGSWIIFARDTRSALRLMHPPDTNHFHMGFRLALVPSS